jgi:hypothetical protein
VALWIPLFGWHSVRGGWQSRKLAKSKLGLRHVRPCTLPSLMAQRRPMTVGSDGRTRVGYNLQAKMKLDMDKAEEKAKYLLLRVRWLKLTLIFMLKSLQSVVRNATPVHSTNSWAALGPLQQATIVTKVWATGFANGSLTILHRRRRNVPGLTNTLRTGQLRQSLSSTSQTRNLMDTINLQGSLPHGRLATVVGSSVTMAMILAWMMVMKLKLTTLIPVLVQEKLMVQMHGFPKPLLMRMMTTRNRYRYQLGQRSVPYLLVSPICLILVTLISSLIVPTPDSESEADSGTGKWYPLQLPSLTLPSLIEKHQSKRSKTASTVCNTYFGCREAAY